MGGDLFGDLHCSIGGGYVSNEQLGQKLENYDFLPFNRKISKIAKFQKFSFPNICYIPIIIQAFPMILMMKKKLIRL